MTPFYEKALNLFKRTQDAQILKGLQKYPEPFNPFSWTPEQLLNHALEETVDLTHYLVGLKDLLDAKDKEIEALKRIAANYREEVIRLKSASGVRTPKKSPFEEQALKESIPPYFDPDDQ